MAGLAVATQFAALKFSSGEWQTMVLSVVTFSQLAHVMAIRSERESLFKQGLLSNKPLLGAVALMVTLQLAVIYAPILNRLFNTQPLRAVELAWTVVSGSIIFLAVELEKWFRRKKTRYIIGLVSAGDSPGKIWIMDRLQNPYNEPFIIAAEMMSLADSFFSDALALQ
jgi:P-type Ca2+ transporter type 2C